VVCFARTAIVTARLAGGAKPKAALAS